MPSTPIAVTFSRVHSESGALSSTPLSAHEDSNARGLVVKKIAPKQQSADNSFDLVYPLDAEECANAETEVMR